MQRDRGLGQKAGPRLRECYRQGHEKVVSISRSRFTKPGVHLLAEPCRDELHLRPEILAFGPYSRVLSFVPPFSLAVPYLEWALAGEAQERFIYDVVTSKQTCQVRLVRDVVWICEQGSRKPKNLSVTCEWLPFIQTSSLSFIYSFSFFPPHSFHPTTISVCSSCAQGESGDCSKSR